MRKSEYSLLLQQARAMLSGETDLIANAANLAALVYHNVERLNWAGFYFLRDTDLVLGPFAGQVACTRIPIGKGVCGTAFARQNTVIVEDVHQFEGHIGCDVASESEIVVPFHADSISGVLDIDSPDKARFGDDERDFFEQLANIYTDAIT